MFTDRQRQTKTGGYRLGQTIEDVVIEVRNGKLQKEEKPIPVSGNQQDCNGHLHCEAGQDRHLKDCPC